MLLGDWLDPDGPRPSPHLKKERKSIQIQISTLYTYLINYREFNFLIQGCWNHESSTTTKLASDC